MNEKKYFIRLDILGFERLAEDIAEKKGLESRKVRTDFIDVIKERIEAMERKGKIIGKNYGRKDDWLLVTDGLGRVFNNILDVLSHNTMYKGYERIPLEIAVGTAEFDKWARFEGEKLIVEKDTIKFLKTYILDYYRKWYEDHHNGQKVKSTFVILTESAYQELEPLDRKMCKKIEYKQNKKHAKFFLANVDRVQQRGRVFEFLGKIGYPDSKWYDRIDCVYIPPLEYEDIKRTLEEKRIVFITGTREYGKTYTTVRLMWEYYNCGYEPKWIKGGEKDERRKVREKLEDIRAELKPGCIIYFEDPFGKTQYERRESLEREIGTLIATPKQVNEAYVLITSREEVFKEFEKEKLSAKELKEFENKLNIKRPSYDSEKRKEILLKWAEEENCNWLEKGELRDLVFSSIEDEEILPTPLSIKSFALATTDVKNEYELKEKIKEKSEDTERAFAKEIENMTDDKILFLSFLFISNFFDIEFVRAVYQELVRELNLEDVWKFGRILNWFKDDKIQIVGDWLEFSHPSYSKSLEHILVKDGYVTDINERIFSKLLLELSERDKAVWSVIRIVQANFDKIPQDVSSKILFKLSEKKKVARDVVWIVQANFDKIPQDVRNKLILNFSERNKVAPVVKRIVWANFDKIPQDVSHLLLKVCEEYETSGEVIWAVEDNLDRLPGDIISKLVSELSGKDEFAGCLGVIVRDKFDKIPQNIRNKLLSELSGMVHTIYSIASILEKNFDKIPQDVRNRLLLELTGMVTGPWDNWVARDVVKIVEENFDKLPQNVSSKLLFELSEKNESAGVVARIVKNNFDKIPQDVRNFFDRL